jgi:hypothetical protein
MFPRGWNSSVFIVNFPIMQITKRKKTFKLARSRQVALKFSAQSSSRSAQLYKKLNGTLVITTFETSHFLATCSVKK